MREQMAKKYAWARDFLLTGRDTNRQNAAHRAGIVTSTTASCWMRRSPYGGCTNG
jgi:hypothetical protein